MEHRRSRVVLSGAAMCLLLVAATARADASPQQALRAYVERADASYAWGVRQRISLGPVNLVELTLTSQTWRDLVWQHRLFVLTPPNVRANTDALLVIEGGSWRDSDAQPIDPASTKLPKEAVLLAAYAQQMGCPIAVLLNVPRQPIFDGKREDAIIAMTFDRYLGSGDASWPLLLPMVKSAVRAMDAVEAFAEQDLKLNIMSFTVTGASKRGWTTWLTAAVDPRVRALAPMVIDMLNIEAQFPHQVMAYGALSNRIHDYTDLNLHHRMVGEAGESLRQIVDPYSYRQQITQPKMLLLGTNDGYWTLDSLNLYWDGLVGEKYIMYVPNADHDLAHDWQRIMGGLLALHRHAHRQAPLPAIRWAYSQGADGTVELTLATGEASSQVNVWTAEAPTRDFRQARWSSKPVKVSPAGEAVARVARPGQGYRAMFAEAVYPRGLLPLHLTTTIRVLEAEN